MKVFGARAHGRSLDGGQLRPAGRRRSSGSSTRLWRLLAASVRRPVAGAAAACATVRRGVAHQRRAVVAAAAADDGVRNTITRSSRDDAPGSGPKWSNRRRVQARAAPTTKGAVRSSPLGAAGRSRGHGGMRSWTRPCASSASTRAPAIRSSLRPEAARPRRCARSGRAATRRPGHDDDDLPATSRRVADVRADPEVAVVAVEDQAVRPGVATRRLQRSEGAVGEQSSEAMIRAGVGLGQAPRRLRRRCPAVDR